MEINENEIREDNNNIDPMEFYKIIRDDKKVYAFTTFNRAIPYYKDGLILVYRRILYDMLKNKYVFKNDTHKSATIVGEIIGKLHPHGDASVYNAIVTQSEPWSNNYPLIFGQGNWGNILGDSAAAYRYTECKLSKFFGDIIEDISPVVVNYIPNFDNSTKEIEYLPFKIPILLVNGSYGIAESYITSVPPHNLIDVANICEKYIRNKNISNEELVDGLYPDCPYYGIITNKTEIENYYKYGTPANIKMKSTMEIDRSNKRIFIKDLPYGMTRKNVTDILRKKIADKDVVLSKVLDIININTIKDGEKFIEFEFVVDKNCNILEVAQAIEYNCTTKTIPLNFIFNYGTHVKNINIKEMIVQWYNVLRSTKLRKYSGQISSAQTEKHILDGLLLIYDYIDDIIKYIKTAENKSDIIEFLKNTYKLTEIQAKAIAEMQLYTISRSSKERLKVEIANLTDKITVLYEKLNGVDDEMIEDLEYLKKTYGRPRRTQVIDENKTSNNIVPVSNGSVLISHNQYGVFDIKNLLNSKNITNGLKSYKTDNGKMVKEICYSNTFNNQNITNLIILSDDDRVKKIGISEIQCTNNWILNTDSVNINNIIPISTENQKIICGYENKFKLIESDSITKNYSGISKTEIFKPLLDTTTHILFITDNGKYTYLPIEEIPVQGKTAGGVNMNCKNDKIVSICQINSNIDTDIIVKLVNDSVDNMIMRIPINTLIVSNRSNSFKQLIDIDKDIKISNIYPINIKLKDSKIILIGNCSTSQISTNSLKSSDMLTIPKKISLDLIDILQYTI